MLFIRKPNVVVSDDPAARAEAQMLAEERGRASATVAGLGVAAVVVIILLVAYFAWWAPVNSAQAAADAANPAVRPSNTTIIEKPAPVTPPTIINTPPPVVHDRVVPVPVPVPDETVPPPVNQDDQTGTDAGAGGTTTDSTTTGG